MTSFLRRIWTYVQPYRTRLILGLVCGILFALSNGALYLVVKEVVNLVFGTGASATAGQQFSRVPAFLRPASEWMVERLSGVDAPSSTGQLLLVIAAIPVVMFFRTVFIYLNIYLVNWASTRAIADLRTRVFEHLQSLPLGFFSTANTGDLIARVTNDTQALRTIIGNSLASLISDPVTIIVLFTLLLTQQPLLTLFSIVVLPACIVPITIYGRKVRKSARAMQTHAADLSRLMHESFTGNRIIKAYNLEEMMLARFREITKKFVSQSMRVVRANEIPGSVLEFLGSVGVTLILFYVVIEKSRSAEDLSALQSATPGGFVAFIGAVFMMYKPLKSLTRLHNQLLQAQAASQRVFELLDTRSTIVEPASPLPVTAAGADIRFENVDFDYGEKPVLRGINLTVRAGQLVALVGSSGSGKTSLVNLLPRFYDPKQGAVRFGPTDIRQVSIKDLRGQIAMVTQETILFHDTIRRNIALGRPEATDAEIEAAAHHANAHEFILQKPEGYEAIAGEKGVNLSGGQRQRIAIARAILKNAPILILDEATSALDTESERAVQAALEQLMKGRTTICIAHRLSTVQKADLIVVMAEGRIVEAGPHAELIRNGGVYQRLYELQFQG